MKSIYHLTLCILCLLTSVSAACAENFELIHKPQTGDTLPPPGERFPLKLTIRGTQRVDLNAQALIVRDGKLMETPLVGTLDEEDHAVYSAEIYTPLAEVSYQFILYPPNNGTPILTKRFVLRRRCLPDISFANVTPSTPKPDDDPAQVALQRARDLEGDLKELEAVVQVLGDIQAVLQEPK